MPTSPFMTVLDAIAARRSIRAFQPSALDEPTIRRLLDAAVKAPTAIHLEPWVFAVVQDRSLLRRISDRAKGLWPKDVPARHEHAAVPAASAFARAMLAPDFNVFYDAGTLIAIGARGEGRFHAADCWLAAENLMLAATAMGLGTCVIGSAIPALNDPETKRELDLPADLTLIAPIIVGVPAEHPEPTSRKPPQIACWRK